MLNPSYLIKSRHDIYYFRYPLPTKDNNRISLSLGTRCRKEALQLAKALEYHSQRLLEQVNFAYMKHAEVKELFRTYYAEVLEKQKKRIDDNGPLSKENINRIRDAISDLESTIESGCDSFLEYLGLENLSSQESNMEQELRPIIERFNLNIPPESDDYKNLKSFYKYAQRNYFNDLLTYNSGVTDYSLLDTNASTKEITSKHTLGELIDTYLKEIQSEHESRAFKDIKSHYFYLEKLLGTDYPVSKIDITTARFTKEALLKTPKYRNKGDISKLEKLKEQIEFAEANNKKLISHTTINKYLTYFSSLFNWALQNKYIEENPFRGLKVKTKKLNSRRLNFTRDEIKTLLAELAKQEKGLANSKTKYWGALLAIYTGARRNEIASLLPNDIKEDENSGIWYISINDEEESKKVKTEAAQRFIPVHSQLIKLGFLEYVEEAKQYIAKRPTIKDHNRRLLYDLTYSNHDKWGRNLGRWFNETLLPKLDLKTEKKTLHSLRHSFITYLSIAEVESAYIKSIVGHEHNTVTSNTYTHYGIEHLPVFKAAIEKLKY